jgi:hypothetical protein
VQCDDGAIDATRGKRGVDRRAGVDDEQIAAAKIVGQAREVRVLQAIVLEVRDEETDLVTGQTACLGRLVRLELGRKEKRR